LVLKSCVRRCRLAGDGGVLTTLLCTLALKSCMRRCHLCGDGGVKLRCFALWRSNPACAGVALAATAELSFAALHFGAQILRAQVSPCWRRQRLAMLLCTLALKSCMRRCRLGGDGGVKLRCFALRCSNPACAGGSLVATAASKATLLCTSVLKSRMRRCRLGGDSGV